MCNLTGPFGVGTMICTRPDDHPPGCSFASGECIPSQEKADGGDDD